MNTIFTRLLLFSLLALINAPVWACNVKPSFTFSATHTCGLPYLVKAVNTSKGSYSATAKYWWKVNNVLIVDSFVGLDSVNVLLKQAGTNKLQLYVKDTSGCLDSSVTNITVTTNAKTILDQNAVYSYTPMWVNCIQFITDPDTFSIRFSSADTLRKLKILWGDGSSDTGSGNLSPNSVKSHLYNLLGIYTLKIISTNNGCIDTVYGKVISQRQPTAGIIGPPSGSNRGCVPHRLKIVNNSYNISNSTTFEIDWGVGPLLNLPYTSSKDTLYNTYKTGMCGGVIKITARNVCGNSVSTWNPIDISDRDKALWTVSNTCDPTKSHLFINASTDRYCLLPDVKEYFWDFGDGTTVGWTTSKAAQNHIFKTEGDYLVTLYTKNGCGYDTFKARVPVFYNPVAAFKYNSNRGCKPLSVTLTDTSKGRGYTRLWVVNENGTVKTFTDSILSYVFTNPGVHTVTLTVTNKCANSSISRNFTVNDKPTAGFAKINSACIPANISFSNTSTSYFTNPNYHWDFGDSTTSNLKNPPPKTYRNAGNYTLRLIVSDSCGVDTFTQAFIAHVLPVAILSGDTIGCTFDSLSFKNQSANANSYSWSFGDGISLSNSQTGIVKHAYITPGSFTIRLISTTGYGCNDTVFYSLKIKPGAKALFDINQSSACNPAVFKFTNNSIYGKNFKWFANGKLISTANSISDSLVNTDTTVIRLKLMVTSNSSCQNDTLEKIYFTPKNPVAIIGNKDSGCGILKVNFVNNSSNYYKSLWTLGNGSTSVLNNPAGSYVSAKKNDTIYYPKLKVMNWLGCKDSTTNVIKVFPQPKAGYTPDKLNGCGPLHITFTNQSITNNKDSIKTLKYVWNFGNGGSSASLAPSATFIAAVTKDTFYTVSLKTTSVNGCSDTLSGKIQVYPAPSVRFTADKKEGCATLAINYTNHSTPNDTGSISIMSFKWSSGNGTAGSGKNFNAAYKAAKLNDTIYRAKLIGYSEHGCADSNYIDIKVHPQPDAKFQVNHQNGCTPLNVATLNLSTSNDGGQLTHLWKFGNNYNSSDENDSTLYYNYGVKDTIYKVWYQATSQYGCKDTTQLDITVRPKPIAKFTVSTKKACAPLLLKVTDASVNAATYQWGQTNNLTNGKATEIIYLPGMSLSDTVYAVNHLVVSAYGCVSDTVFQDIILLGKPVADFEFSKDSLCSRENVSMSNNTLGGYKYLWKFGDNTTSTLINPKHKFTILQGLQRDSLFNVSLEVTSFAGCKDTIRKSILIVSKPTDKIILDKSFGCTDLSIKMLHKSATFKTMYWDLGDNSNFVSSDSFVHTYVNLYDNLTMQPKITLYRQRFNCLDTIRTSVMVYPKPVASFKTVRNDPCDAGEFQFINQSKNNQTNVWSIDNRYSYTVPNLSLTLLASNAADTSYKIKLYIKNSYQCKDSIEQTVKVKQKQIIRFVHSPLIACENGKIDFTNESSAAVRYFWNFGDGGMSNELNPSYVYNKYGDYKVMLYGFDKDGCIDSSDGNTFVKVLERPKADFTYLPFTPKLPNARVDFIASPLINSVSLNQLAYEWDFGDNTYPTVNKNIQNPFHIYTMSGTLLVKLTVWNQGCSNMIVKPIYIEDPKPEISFTPDTLEGCVPLKVKFKNKSVNVVSYRWIFGDGSPDATDKEPTHVFELPGVWDVTLIATGTGGTSAKTYKYLINTFPKPFVDFYTIKRSVNLPNAIFNMQNTSINIVKSEWMVYDSLQQVVTSSVMRDPSFNLPYMGRYGVKLIGTNSYGCSDTMHKSEYLDVLSNSYVYTPNAFSPNKNGKNDAFRPSLYNIKPDQYMFRIYNRWGEKLFETTEREAEWDGVFNGQPCEQDTYIWTLSGEYENGDLFSYRGTVTLLR